MTTKSPKVKKRKFADPKMVSAQLWELRYIANKFSIEVEQVRDVKKKVGRGRKAVYKEIRENVC